VADDPRVQQLLDEISNSGWTPEEVCGACPELLPEVRRRWQQMCAVRAELHALFPTPGPDPDAETTPHPSGHRGAELPQVPGYEVGALLGRGGMGLVYKARHLRLNRFVALTPDFPDEPLSMAQDLREPPWFSGVFALFLPS
jgi:serine/threonine-protein kinase